MLKRKKNIGIFTYNMLPYSKSFGSCQRMFFLAKQLVSSGYNVKVYSFKDDMKPNDFSYNISFDQSFLTHAKRNNYFFRFLRKVFVNIQLTKILNFSYYNELNFWRAFNLDFWLRKHYRKFIKGVLNDKIDVFIISAVPFTMFNIVEKLKKYDIKVVVDYRDPWNDIRKNRKWNYINKKEYSILKNANLITTFSEKFSNDLSKFYLIDQSKIISVYNGFSKESWEQVGIKQKPMNNDKIIITYTGTYSLQHLQNIYYALKEHPYSQKIELRFIGPNNESKLKNNWISNLKSKVVFVDTVAHNKALELMLESDVLLVYYWRTDYRADYMLTGKFMDYLNCKKMIWGIGESNFNFIEKINKMKLGMTCSNDYHSIFNIFSKLVAKRNNKESFNVNNNLVSKYSREMQNSKFLKKLEQI